MQLRRRDRRGRGGGSGPEGLRPNRPRGLSAVRRQCGSRHLTRDPTDPRDSGTPATRLAPRRPRFASGRCASAGDRRALGKGPSPALDGPSGLKCSRGTDGDGALLTRKSSTRTRRSARAGRSSVHAEAALSILRGARPEALQTIEIAERMLKQTPRRSGPLGPEPGGGQAARGPAGPRPRRPLASSQRNPCRGGVQSPRRASTRSAARRPLAMQSGIPRPW